MPTIEDEIGELEREIKKTQYNKATEHHIGRLKAKVAKLERIKEERSRKGGGIGFFIRKGIYPSVGLVGPPSVGKSSILNAVTNADSKIGSFDFTTLSLVPGIMEFRGMKFRLIDMPGIIEGAHEGKGRGREVVSVLRGVDLVVIVLDAYKHDPGYIIDELSRAGIRLNQKPPRMTVKKLDSGGINVMTTNRVNIDTELFLSIAREFGLVNADIVVRQNMSPETFIDGLLGNRIYLPSIIVLNKSDVEGFQQALASLKSSGIDPVPISVTMGTNIEVLKREIASKIRMIRVNLIPADGGNDGEPLVVREGSTVEDVCRAVHSDFVEKFKFATISGSSVKFMNQRVGLEHTVQDGDRLTVFLRKG